MSAFGFAGVVEAMGEVCRILDTRNYRLQQGEAYEAATRSQSKWVKAKQEETKKVGKDSQDELSGLSDRFKSKKIERTGNTPGKQGRINHWDGNDSN